MFQPKRMKYRKYQKNINIAKKDNSSNLVFGQYGVKALTNGSISAQTLEAMRQTLNRHLKKTGKIWFRVYPDKPCTKKPAEVRMGKGKGSVSHWIAKIPSGQILFEMNALSYELAFQACQSITPKLAIPVKFIQKEK
jgi:large subunit ribosomal protein L16